MPDALHALDIDTYTYHTSIPERETVPDLECEAPRDDASARPSSSNPAWAGGAADTAAAAVRLGELCFSIDDGALRTLCWRGVEVVRQVSAPVRDTVWGTVPVEPLESDRTHDDHGWHHRRRSCARHDGQVACIDFRITATTDADSARVTVEVAIDSDDGFDTNRAGLCLLHPLDGLRDQPFELDTPDGSTHETRFPAADRIAPSQPATDIAALRHRIHGIDVDIRFLGERFEMEDQRNWSDASYKTYCRPLRLPTPYAVTRDAPVRQRVEIRLSGRPALGPASAPSPVSDRARDPGSQPVPTRLPAMSLAVAPDWLDMTPIDCDGLVARFLPERPWSTAEFETLLEWHTRIGGDLTLEIVLGAHDPEHDLVSLRDALEAHGLAPARVIALPADYLRSHQPDGPWSDGLSPAHARAATAARFPDARVGVGMLTYFTELNRCPPEPDAGDWLTWSTAAIVHAADTRSVFETLEALPDIFATGRRIAGERAIRLGLVAIGMRSNPYGQGLAAPGEDRFVTMTDHDTRHLDERGAAFGIAATLLAARAGVESLCLGATGGPFGMTTLDGEPTPLARGLRSLRRLAVTPGFVTGTAPGLIAFTNDRGRVRVNASLDRHDELAPFAIDFDFGAAGR